MFEERRRQKRDHNPRPEALKHDHDWYDGSATTTRHKNSHHKDGQHDHIERRHREASHHVADRRREDEDFGGAAGKPRHTARKRRVLPPQSILDQ